MDNLCHTLVGAALAESGLKRRTTFGAATLMIAANFPDIDVLAVPLGHSLGFRRGITHGLPAHAVLPLVLTALMLAWHRVRRRDQTPPDPRWLLILSAIGIWTHPLLDWMNTYGMRWLMPLDPAWSYADTLFIVDPLIWLALGAGVWLARRRATRGESTLRAARPARVAVVFVAAYVLAMAGVARWSKSMTIETLATQGINADTVVVEPVFASPVRRRVIYHWQGAYHLASLQLVPGPSLSDPWFRIPINDAHPAARAAVRTPMGQEYHSWARLPYYVIDEQPDTTWVSIGDARYTLDGRSSWASVRIAVPTGASTAMLATPREPDTKTLARE